MVYPTAEVGSGCTIGPYAVIGPNVHLGSGCIIYPHAVIQGPVVMGNRNIVHSFACIGGPPQDLRYRGEKTMLAIGHSNEFREHVTINRGTVHGGGITTIGDNNLLMAYSHVAHDCILGNRIVMANQATLAGHTLVEDYAVFGGMVAVAAFVKIGESAMLAAGSMVERDVPPFCIVAGDRAKLRTINRVGLDRRDISPEARFQIRTIIKSLKNRGHPLARIIEEFTANGTLEPEPKRMIAFLAGVKRGLTR